MQTSVSNLSKDSSACLGSLFVVSGPSGSGKTTLCRRSTGEGLTVYSISCTTRAPRHGERDGCDYHFLSVSQFQEKITHGDFLEYAEVHGNFYGTLKADILELLHEGKTIVLDIDVQGAQQVRNCSDDVIRQCYADVFIHVPMDELELRLRGRESDLEEVIALRLKNAAEEEAQRHLYQHTLISGSREGDYAYFMELLKSLKPQ